MKIAVVGKGGSGKTSIAGSLARILSRAGVDDLLAIDGDSNPNLALTLGIPASDTPGLSPMPRSVLDRGADADGKPQVTLAMTPAEIIRQFGISAPDDITLLLMGSIDHAGGGWMCGPHAAVRMLVGELIEHNRRNTVVDMEAGVEHLSRGTIRFVDCALVIVEPYFKSMETGARIARLAGELGVGAVYTVANKVRSDADRKALESFCKERGLRLKAELPFDESLLEAERKGRAPLDHTPGGTAMQALGRLAGKLREEFS